MRPGWVGALAIGLVLSGCVAPSTSVPLGPAAAVEGPRVVVAVLDGGINPWHTAFQSAPSSPPRLPVPYEIVPATFRQRLEAEGLEAWNTLAPEQLYWFEGTRVLGISMLRTANATDVEAVSRLEDVIIQEPAHLIYDDENHGTPVASVLARSSPHAWILMVQVTALSLDAVRWTVSQPWVDIISSSRGNTGHFPDNFTGEPDAFAATYQQAVLDGKLVVQAGGNDPSPNLLFYGGAPWIISVGGAEAAEKGPDPSTSQPVDVVAQMTVAGLARNSSNEETFTGAGTSFGAPAVAGVLAEALYQLRAGTGHDGGIVDGAFVAAGGRVVTNVDLRNALNLTAAYWQPTEYEPTVNASRNPVLTVLGRGSPALPHVEGTPVGPWVQMGWGFVDDSTDEAMVALLTDATSPPDKRDAAAYMEKLFALRSEVWAARQGGSR